MDIFIYLLHLCIKVHEGGGFRTQGYRKKDSNYRYIHMRSTFMYQSAFYMLFLVYSLALFLSMICGVIHNLYIYIYIYIFIYLFIYPSQPCSTPCKR